MNAEKIKAVEERLAICETIINATDDEIRERHLSPEMRNDISPASVRSAMKRERSQLKHRLAVLKGEKPKRGTKQMKIKVRTWNRPDRASIEIEAPYDDMDRCEQDCDEIIRFASALFHTRHLPDSEREAARAAWLAKYDEDYEEYARVVAESKL